MKKLIITNKNHTSSNQIIITLCIYKIIKKIIMLIFRGDTSNATIGGAITGGTDDNKIVVSTTGGITAIQSYLENGKPKEVIVGKDSENKDIKATGLYLSIGGQPTNATIFIRAINCAFIITRLMIIFIEKDPAKEAIVEFINPAFNSNAGFSSDKMVNIAIANSEIKLSLKDEDKPGFDSTNLITPLTIAPTGGIINKFMKVHDPVKGKRNYLIDFSFQDTTFKTFKLKQTPVDFLNSSDLSMSFEKLVDIFSKALIEDDSLDLSGEAGELTALKNKNKKLLKAIDESKKYLNNSKNNLINYGNKMPIIK